MTSYYIFFALSESQANKPLNKKRTIPHWQLLNQYCTQYIRSALDILSLSLTGHYNLTGFFHCTSSRLCVCVCVLCCMSKWDSLQEVTPPPITNQKTVSTPSSSNQQSDHRVCTPVLQSEFRTQCLHSSPPISVQNTVTAPSSSNQNTVSAPSSSNQWSEHRVCTLLQSVIRTLHCLPHGQVEKTI